MICRVVFAWTLCLSAVTLAEEQLPRPEYHRQPNDPAWLETVVEFHGHLGPVVVAGTRMGMIGRRAVEAKGYFDVQVTCKGPLAKPPQSCFLDGVQVATGATMGKRSLQCVQADRIMMQVRNTRTGRTVELRPTPILLDLLTVFKPRPKVGAGAGTKADDEQLEKLARKIATLPAKDVASVIYVDGTTN